MAIIPYWSDYIQKVNIEANYNGEHLNFNVYFLNVMTPYEMIAITLLLVIVQLKFSYHYFIIKMRMVIKSFLSV